jgi:GDP-6-deoxy-D-talose 4-dehydrogenase
MNPENSRVLITGIEGFTGRYLSDELRSHGYEIFGLSNSHHETIGNDKEHIFKCDLINLDLLKKTVQQINPDFVIHLAAIAFVSHDDVGEMYSTNIVGTKNLLESLLPIKNNIKKVVIASSANVYGNSDSNVLTENTSIAPANDYAVSKVAKEFVAKIYSHDLPILLTRPFNYTGIGQSEKFLIPKIISHIREKKNIIELGNIDVSRDFTDVRDVVKIYRHLMENVSIKNETISICSGNIHSLEDILNMAQEASGHSIKININPQFVRSNEIKILRGSNEKLISLIGEYTFIPMIKTIEWMIHG